MQRWININQEVMFEWDLSYPEAFLCSFYALEHNWVKTRINHDDGDFLCIALTKVMKEVPALGTKSNYSKVLSSLCNKGFFERVEDEDNCRIVFYRMSPAFKIMWKYREVNISSNLENKFLNISTVEENILNIQNDNTISKTIQVFPNGNEVFPNGNEVFPNGNLSYNIISNKPNQINHNHNKEDEDNLSVKNQTLEKEFNRLLEFYPKTVNNKSQHIAKAFGTYQSLDNSKKPLVLQAVKHYSKSEYVHSKQNDTKFIPSIHSFLTKGNFSEILQLPIHKDFSESLEKNSEEVGAECVGKYYNENESVEFVTLCGKFRDSQDIEDEKDIEEVLGAEDFKIFCEEVGLHRLNEFPAEQLADTMIDIKRELQNGL